MLDVFTFLVMFMIVAATIFLLLKLGGLPGKIARDRNHPQADAIRVCGWLGLATLGLLWPIAFVWSFTKPSVIASPAGQASQDGKLSAQIVELQAKVSVLESELERRGRENGRT
jgi:hypothetical protein